MIVLDASVVGPLAVPDEHHTLSDTAVALLLSTPLLVPMHWHLEVGSMIQTAQRRGRIETAVAHRLLHGALILEPEIDQLTAAHAWRVSLPLAERHRLTIYDAAYLELASRRSAMLATLDGALAAAARADNVTLVELA